MKIIIMAEAFEIINDIRDGKFKSVVVIPTSDWENLLNKAGETGFLGAGTVICNGKIMELEYTEEEHP